MAQTDAQRQAAFRQRHLKDGTDSRLNLVISHHAWLTLKQLAAHSGTTQRRVIETLLARAQDDVISNLAPSEQSGYYDRVTA